MPLKIISLGNQLLGEAAALTLALAPALLGSPDCHGLTDSTSHSPNAVWTGEQLFLCLPPQQILKLLDEMIFHF